MSEEEMKELIQNAFQRTLKELEEKFDKEIIGIDNENN